MVQERVIKQEIAEKLLIRACRVNGLWQENEGKVLATIASAFRRIKQEEPNA
jgi:hypothetical protein